MKAIVMRNIPIYEALAQASDKVVVPQTRRTVSRGHGKM
jgi:hypothetical protein